MKKLLTYINLILGVASMALAGCHSQKNLTKSETPPSARETREPELICMYGVPANLEPQQQDTVKQPRQLPDEPRPMMKYGVPNPRISE